MFRDSLKKRTTNDDIHHRFRAVGNQRKQENLLVVK